LSNPEGDTSEASKSRRLQTLGLASLLRLFHNPPINCFWYGTRLAAKVMFLMSQRPLVSMFCFFINFVPNGLDILGIVNFLARKSQGHSCLQAPHAIPFV